MTEAEIYEFDLNGYILYRDLIPAGDLRRMNETIDADLDERNTGNFSFLDLDAIFMEVMALPLTLRIMRVIIGDWMRLDHAYGIQMTSDMDTHENLHGRLRADRVEHQCQWANGRMWNSLIVIMYGSRTSTPAMVDSSACRAATRPVSIPTTLRWTHTWW